MAALDEETINIKVKTLDSSLYDFSVAKHIGIPELKSRIAESTRVPEDRQRLIYQGKVLKNTDRLSTYKVEDGHVVHLVARPPPSDLEEERSRDRSPGEMIGNEDRSLPTAVEIPLDDEAGSGPGTDFWNSILTGALSDGGPRRGRRRDSSRGTVGDSLESVRQNILSLETLLSMTNVHTIHPIRTRFSLQNRIFQVGQWVDVKDTVDQWLEAQVMQVSRNQVFIHYNGWPSRWDEWIEMDSPRIAPYRTYTSGSATSAFLTPSPTVQPDGGLVVDNDERNSRILLRQTTQILSRVTPMLEHVNYLSSLNGYYQSMARDVNPSAQEEHVMELRRLTAHLAPLMDRLGRALTDMAPHVANLSYTPDLSQPSSEVVNTIIPLLPSPGQLLSSGQFGRLGGEGNIDIHIHAILSPVRLPPSAAAVAAVAAVAAASSAASNLASTGTSTSTSTSTTSVSTNTTPSEEQQTDILGYRDRERDRDRDRLRTFGRLHRHHTTSYLPSSSPPLSATTDISSNSSHNGSHQPLTQPVHPLPPLISEPRAASYITSPPAYSSISHRYESDSVIRNGSSTAARGTAGRAGLQRADTGDYSPSRFSSTSRTLTEPLIFRNNGHPEATVPARPTLHRPVRPEGDIVSPTNRFGRRPPSWVTRHSNSVSASVAASSSSSSSASPSHGPSLSSSTATTASSSSSSTSSSSFSSSASYVSPSASASEVVLSGSRRSPVLPILSPSSSSSVTLPAISPTSSSSASSHAHAHAQQQVAARGGGDDSNRRSGRRSRTSGPSACSRQVS